MKRGSDLLRDKTLNRSIAFTRKDRDRLGVRGLLPHRVATEGDLVKRLIATCCCRPCRSGTSGCSTER